MLDNHISIGHVTHPPFHLPTICLHNTEVKRVAGARIYIECLDCMKTTLGVEVKGHRYAEAR
jgi:hypothetical protein